MLPQPGCHASARRSMRYANARIVHNVGCHASARRSMRSRPQTTNGGILSPSSPTGHAPATGVPCFCKRKTPHLWPMRHASASRKHGTSGLWAMPPQRGCHASARRSMRSRPQRTNAGILSPSRPTAHASATGVPCFRNLGARLLLAEACARVLNAPTPEYCHHRARPAMLPQPGCHASATWVPCFCSQKHALRKCPHSPRRWVPCFCKRKVWQLWTMRMLLQAESMAPWGYAACLCKQKAWHLGAMRHASASRKHGTSGLWAMPPQPGCHASARRSMRSRPQSTNGGILSPSSPTGPSTPSA